MLNTMMVRIHRLRQHSEMGEPGWSDTFALAFVLSLVEDMRDIDGVGVKTISNQPALYEIGEKFWSGR